MVKDFLGHVDLKSTDVYYVQTVDMRSEVS